MRGRPSKCYQHSPDLTQNRCLSTMSEAIQKTTTLRGVSAVAIVTSFSRRVLSRMPHFGIPATFRHRPDAEMLAACADFRRLNIALAAIPDTAEQALDAAWTARQAVAEWLMGVRPVTDAGRREKARVAVTILLEVPKWQQDAEVMLALAAFRAEAFA